MSRPYTRVVFQDQLHGTESRENRDALWTLFFDPNETQEYSLLHKADRRCSKASVFERLTDHRFYTGAHRERFDEFGNGRGIAGREDVKVHDGFTESSTRTHSVYSSVVRPKRKPVVTPGTVGVQRYGVQIRAPRLLWLYRNGDKHCEGVAYYIRPHIKTLESLYFEITKVIKPVIGPVRRIFDQNLQPVKSLEDFVDGAKYLCCSGEPPSAPCRLEKFLSDWVIQRSGN